MGDEWALSHDSSPIPGCRWRDRAQEVLRRSAAELMPGLDPQRQAEELDEADRRPLVELVALAIGGLLEAVERVGRLASGHREAALVHLDAHAATDEALRAGDILHQVQVVGREPQAVVDQ